jgi:hypothetical protein
MLSLARFRLTWLSLALLALSAAPLHALTPRDELLRFVPDNVGFCVALQNLREHGTTLWNSPFADQVRRSPLGVSLSAAQELKQLGNVEQELQKHLGIGWTELRDDILGEAIVFAYRPGPPGKPEQDRALLLLRARNAKTLASVIDRFNEVQKKTKMVKELEEREYKGLKYWKRVDRRETTFYYLRGPVVLTSSKEEMLREAMDCELALSPTAEPALAPRLRQLGAELSVLALWVNPRAFDAELEGKLAKLGAADPKTAALLNAFLGYWKSLEGLAFSINLDRNCSLSLGVKVSADKLPAPARKFLTEARPASEVWRWIPDNALVAFAARVDGVALLEILTEFLPPERRQAVHTDLDRKLGAFLNKRFVKDVLPNVGPDFGFYLVAPPTQEKGWFPHAIFAVRVGVGDPAAPVDQALLEAIQFLARQAQVGHNLQHPDKKLTLEKITLEKREITFLRGDQVFPPGLQPALALHNGWLLLGTAPVVISRFGATSVPLPEPTSPIPLVRVSVKEWRSFLKERRQAILEEMSKKPDVKPEDAAKSLDNLLAGLEFIDRVDLRQHAGKEQVIFTLTLQPAQPLKK